jgi:NAD-dependent deacetylase
VPSGIPDFRSPGTGLWEKVDPMEVAHISVFERDPARFWRYYRPRFQTLGDKRPNAAHAALAELERRGLLAGVITQNVDRLHGAAGSREVVEVHGSIETSSCTACGTSVELEQVERLFDGAGVAICAECGGRLAIVTQGPTAYDDVAAVKLEGEVDEELSALLASFA